MTTQSQAPLMTTLSPDRSGEMESLAGSLAYLKLAYIGYPMKLLYNLLVTLPLRVHEINPGEKGKTIRGFHRHPLCGMASSREILASLIK